MGKTINEVRRMWLPLSVTDDYPYSIYSYMNSFDVEKECPELSISSSEELNFREEDEKGQICDININIDHYRMCKAKTAHDPLLGKIDVSSVKKSLPVAETPHLDTKALYDEP